jgi:hypothetical protein
MLWCNPQAGRQGSDLFFGFYEPGEPGGGSTPSEPTEPIGGGGSNQWKNVYSTSEIYGHLITLDTEIQGDKVSRAISHAHTGYRDTSTQTITPDHRNGSAYITRTGKATDYIGVDGNERLAISDIASVTGLTFHEDFIEATVEYENGRMVMNNWVDALTFNK